jgi:DNA replication and repair protein RecF
VQLHPRYHGIIREYERALRQRNSLLREAEGRIPAGLEAWDEALAGPGGALCAGRADALAALAPAAAASFAAVGGASRFEVGYAPNVDRPDDPGAEAWTTAIRRRLEERHQDEILRKTTLAGPHRDDLEVAVDGLPARSHASQGEAWLATLALILGSHAAISNRIGVTPVLLLDDAFGLLDPDRRERLAAALPERAQVVATTSDSAELPKSLSWEVFRVTVGSVSSDA